MARERMYASPAERQAAYRERKRNSSVTVTNDEPGEAQRLTGLLFDGRKIGGDIVLHISDWIGELQLMITLRCPSCGSFRAYRLLDDELSVLSAPIKLVCDNPKCPQPTIFLRLMAAQTPEPLMQNCFGAYVAADRGQQAEDARELAEKSGGAMLPQGREALDAAA